MDELIAELEDDLVSRLRAADETPSTVTSWRDLVSEAANKIEALETTLKARRATLSPGQ